VSNEWPARISSRAGLLFWWYDAVGDFGEVAEVAFFAATDETFGDGLEIFPTGADASGFVLGDMVVGSGAGDDGEEIGEVLNDLVGGRDEGMRVGPVGFRVIDEEAAGTFAEPLNDAEIACAMEEGLDAVEWIGRPAACGVVGFGPFVDEGKGQAELGGDLFGAGFGEDVTQQFMGLHGSEDRGAGRVVNSLRWAGGLRGVGFGLARVMGAILIEMRSRTGRCDGD
jgi:hypothetical protein